ncbi:hypothetical protein ACWDZ4_04285 [Streptomyces sp. NPDC003016]
MPALCPGPVPRAVRRGVLTALLVLTAVLAVVLGERGAVQARSPVMPAAEAALGAGAEGQPSDAADSEARGGGEGSRGARRGRARGRTASAGVVVSYRRARSGHRLPRPAARPRGLGLPVEGPLARAVRRCVVLRC